MKTLLQILLYIWQLPQNLVGIIIGLFYKTDNTLLYKDKVVRVCSKFPGGISLGNTLIVSKFPYNKQTWNTVKHEWGHTRQSILLGPLYLLVVGIPSLIWAGIYDKTKGSYFSFYTERWADKLSNVKR